MPKRIVDVIGHPVTDEPPHVEGHDRLRHICQRIRYESESELLADHEVWRCTKCAKLSHRKKES